MILSIIDLNNIQLIDKFSFNKFYNYLYHLNKSSNYVWLRIKDFKNTYFIHNLYSSIREKIINPKLFISTDFNIALKYNFDGVWLNKNTYDLYLKEYKSNNIYSKLLIGYSAHSIEEINKIESNYYTLSPIFDTPKDYKVNPLGKINITNKVNNKSVFALGGMELSMEDEFINLGFIGIAGIRFNLHYLS